DLHPLRARRDGKRWGETCDRVGRDAVDGVVVVRGVVVECDQPPGAGEPREADRVLDGAVTPADAFGVLGSIVLTVVNQDVRLGGEGMARRPCGGAGEVWVPESRLVV